ncbi:hypothetical protein BSKO_01302 [Bryopsis sp. KO-2023]|nr:hypothetical protein BSKO_01302 [Bryopsis sp. KO-2023]
MAVLIGMSQPIEFPAQKATVTPVYSDILSLISSGAFSDSYADSFASSSGGLAAASSLAESFAQGNNAPAFASSTAVSVAEATSPFVISGGPVPQSPTSSSPSITLQQSVPTVVADQFEPATPVQEPAPIPIVIQTVSQPQPQPVPIVVQSVPVDPPVTTAPVVVQSSPVTPSPQPATVLVQAVPAPQPSTEPNQVVLTVLQAPTQNDPEITQQSVPGLEPCYLIKRFFICGTWDFDETVESLKTMLQLAAGLPSGQAFVEDTLIFDPVQCQCAAELNVTYVVSVKEGDIPQDQIAEEYLESTRSLIDEVISRSIIPNEGVSCVIRNKFPTEFEGECGQNAPIVPQSVPEPIDPLPASTEGASVSVLSQDVGGMSNVEVFQNSPDGGCTVTVELTLCLPDRFGVLEFIAQNDAFFSQELGLSGNTFAQSARYQEVTAELNGCVPGEICNCQLVLRLAITIPVTAESANSATEKLDRVANDILGAFTGSKSFLDATCSNGSVFASARTSTRTASIAMVSVVGVLLVALLLAGIALVRRIRSRTDGVECSSNRSDSFSGSEVWDPQPPVRYPGDLSFRAMTPRRPVE